MRSLILCALLAATQAFAAPGDWADRSGHASVTYSNAFDAAGDLGPSYNNNTTPFGTQICAGTGRIPTFHSDGTSEGGGNFRTLINPNEIACNGGNWNYSAYNDTGKLYLQGDRVYYQYRYRRSFTGSTTSDTYQDVGGDGLKQLIWSEQSSTCSQTEITIQDSTNRGVGQIYSACGGMKLRCHTDMGVNCGYQNSGGNYYLIYGDSQFDTGARGADTYACFYGGPGQMGDPSYPASDCPVPNTNTWYTILVEVDLLNFPGGNGTTTGNWVRWWMAEDGGPYIAMQGAKGNYPLSYGTDSPVGFAKWVFTSFTTGGTGSGFQPVQIDYDSFIIASEAIPSPNGDTPANVLYPRTGGPVAMPCPRNFTVADDAATIKTDFEDTSCNTYTFEVGDDLSGLADISIVRSGTSGTPVTVGPSSALSGHPVTLSAANKPLIPGLIWAGDYIEFTNLSVSAADDCLNLTGSNFSVEDIECVAPDDGVRIAGDNGMVKMVHSSGSTNGTGRIGIFMDGQNNTAEYNEIQNPRGRGIVLDGSLSGAHHNYINFSGIQTDCSGGAGDQCMDAEGGIFINGANNMVVYSNTIVGTRPADTTLGQSGVGPAVGLEGGVSFSGIDNNILADIGVALATVSGAVTNIAYNLNWVYLTPLTAPQVGHQLNGTTLSEFVNNTIRTMDGASGHVWLDPSTGDNAYRAHLLVNAGNYSSALVNGSSIDGSVYVNSVTLLPDSTLTDGPFDPSVVGGSLDPCFYATDPISGPGSAFIPNVRATSSVPWNRDRDAAEGVPSKYGLGPDISHPPGGPEDMCVGAAPS